MTFKDFYSLISKEPVNTPDDLPYPVTTVRFKKGEIITKYDQVEGAVYFINEGIVEMTIKSYVSEKVIDFFFQHEMCTCLTSFLTQLPSDVQMTALVDCEAEMIEHHHVRSAYVFSPGANKFGRILTEQAYLRKAKREKDFLCKTAEERYAEMFQTHQHYLSQIPVNKVAKYLGVHPESLSRIRKKMSS